MVKDKEASGFFKQYFYLKMDEVIVRCPEFNLEKKWSFPQYEFTLNGEPIKDDSYKIVLKDKHSVYDFNKEKPFEVSLASLKGLIGISHVEPEIESWFEKEFGPQGRNLLKTKE